MFDPSEPCFHRHETIYRREFQGDEPVETITQTCEVARVEAQSGRRVEQYRVYSDGAPRPRSEDAAPKDQDEDADEDADEEDEAFAGIFV